MINSFDVLVIKGFTVYMEELERIMNIRIHYKFYTVVSEVASFLGDPVLSIRNFLALFTRLILILTLKLIILELN